jgi:hypothetical protein
MAMPTETLLNLFIGKAAENVTACEYPIVFPCFQLAKVMPEKANRYTILYPEVYHL